MNSDGLILLIARIMASLIFGYIFLKTFDFLRIVTGWKLLYPLSLNVFFFLFAILTWVRAKWSIRVFSGMIILLPALVLIGIRYLVHQRSVDSEFFMALLFFEVVACFIAVVLWKIDPKRAKFF